MSRMLNAAISVGEKSEGPIDALGKPLESVADRLAAAVAETVTERSESFESVSFDVETSTFRVRPEADTDDRKIGKLEATLPYVVGLLGLFPLAAIGIIGSGHVLAMLPFAIATLFACSCITGFDRYQFEVEKEEA